MQSADFNARRSAVFDRLVLSIDLHGAHTRVRRRPEGFIVGNRVQMLLPRRDICVEQVIDNVYSLKYYF